MVTPRSAPAVTNLDSFFPPETHHCTCVPLSPFVGSRSSYRNQSSPVLACCWLCSFSSSKPALFFLSPGVPSLAVSYRQYVPSFLHGSLGPFPGCFLPAVGPLFSSWVLGSLPWLFLTSSRSALFFMGPWVLSLAVFLLILPALSCARHWRRDPAGTTPGHFIRTPIHAHHVVLNLGFALIILHVVLRTFTARLVLFHCTPCVPSRFLWSLVRGLVSEGFLSPHARPATGFTCSAWSGGLQHHSSSPFRVLRV